MAAVLSIGKEIKEARLNRGLSQHKLEEILGWGSGTVSKYEKGINGIPDNRKKQIFDYLEIGVKTETEPAPEPVKESLFKNAEGYMDTTMGQALKKAMIKYTDHLPGEVWIHKRANGGCLNKLILNISGNMAYCITVFAKSSRNTDFKIKETSGATKYASVDRLEAIRLKELETRTSIIAPKSVEDVKLHIAAIYGVAVVVKEVEVPVEKVVEKEVVKEVKVEVPVEKVVEKEVVKEVPVEVPIETDDVELNILRREVDIYKDMVDRLLPKRNEVINNGPDCCKPVDRTNSN